MTKFNTYYDRVRPPALSFTGAPSATQQHFKDECDINILVKKYRIESPLAEIPQMTVNNGRLFYIDDTVVGEPLERALTMRQAYSFFERLPNAVRLRFGFNPEAFLSFISTADSADIMSLGIPGFAWRDNHLSKDVVSTRSSIRVNPNTCFFILVPFFIVFTRHILFLAFFSTFICFFSFSTFFQKKNAAKHHFCVCLSSSSENRYFRNERGTLMLRYINYNR